MDVGRKGERMDEGVDGQIARGMGDGSMAGHMDIRMNGWIDG